MQRIDPLTRQQFHPNWLLMVPIAVTVLVAAGSFWVSELTPAEEWPDPVAPRRERAVLLGLAAPIVAGLFAIPYAFRIASVFWKSGETAKRHGRHLTALGLVAACVLACFSFGWRNYPYWANGLYQYWASGDFEAAQRESPGTDYLPFDPKGCIPMTWIGELWWVPVFFYPIALLVFSLGLAVLAIRNLRRQQYRLLSSLTIHILILAWVPLFWRVHRLTLWLLD